MIIENQNIKLRENRMKHKVIDIHLHIGGIGNSSPCKMSKKFLTSPAYLYMVIRSGIPLDQILKDHDGVLRKTLIDRLNGASSVDFDVFLAFDAVYKENGEVDHENSHMITPNDYVMDMAKNNKKVLFGASVHPNRGVGKGMEELVFSHGKKVIWRNSERCSRWSRRPDGNCMQISQRCARCFGPPSSMIY